MLVSRALTSALPSDDLPEGVLRFVLCKAGEIDGHGTIIAPGGVDISRHRRNPVFLWQHQSGTDMLGQAPPPSVVIGKVTEYDQTEERLIITVLFDLADETAATCYRKARDGFLSGVSIGCRVDPEEIEEREIDGKKVPVYRKTLLLEASLVIIPSLESALVVGRAYEDIDFSISKGVRAALERALGWVKEGLGGDGLTDGAKRDARKLLDTGKWWPEKVRKANAFFARHGAQAGPWEDEDGSPTPKRVAWDLWGGDPGESQVKRLSVQMDRAESDRSLAERDASVGTTDSPPPIPPDELRAPGTEVQSVIFDKASFSLEEARAWLRAHDFKVPDVDETEDSYRFRQREPGEFQEGSFRTIEITAGVKAVIGRPKEREDMPEDHIVRVDGAREPSQEPQGGTAVAAAPEPPPPASDAPSLASGEGIRADSGASLRADAVSLPYAERDGVLGTPSPYETLYTAIVDRRKRMDKRTYRAICRGLINHEMDGAEMHGYAAEMDGMLDEGRTLHKGEMRSALKRAEELTRLIAIDLDDDEGEGGVARSVPAFKDAECRAEFAAVAQKAGKLPVTLASVVQRRFGTVDPIAVDTKALAANGAAERLKLQREEARKAAVAAQSEERERLIAKLLDPKAPVITPAEADEMRGIDPATKAETGLPAWTPERIQTLARERGASVVTEIVRAAPLRSVEGTPAQSFTPAPQQGRPEPTAPTTAKNGMELRFTRGTAPNVATEADLMALVQRASAGLGVKPDDILRRVSEMSGTSPIVPGATSAV
mgnify:FL=1